MTDVIPFDASPRLWMHHEDLGEWVPEGRNWVQVLSMQADGVWVRFLLLDNLKGQKVYVPMQRIKSMTMEDDAWPES